MFTRSDRIFPLREACTYPGIEFCDMVFYLPPSERNRTRLWMLTDALSPEVMIDHHEFKPIRVVGKKYRWVDFGIVEAPIDGIHGFAQIRFFGVSSREAENSYFVVTTQTDKELSGNIEGLEEELWGIKREQVGLTFINPSTVEVGKPTVFKLIYQAPMKGMPRGSYIRLCLPNAFATPQVEKKGQDGWIEICHSDSLVKLSSIGTSEESHEKTDVIYLLPEGFPPNGKMTVKYHTEFTYLFESVFSEMERRYWYSKMPPLSLAVAVDKRNNFVPPLGKNGHSVRFTAGEPERLHLFLPGRRKEWEEIKLTGIITDKYRNVTNKYSKMKIRLEIEGGAEKEIGTPAGYFTHEYRFLVPLSDLKPGLYRVKAIDEGTGKITAISNPLEIVESDSKKPNVYWGEIHGHSEMSDGLGRFEEMFRHAKEVGSLDFAASGDHACYFTDNQWEWMQDVTNSYNEPDRFCTIIGYEWAGKQGHRNIYTSGKRLKLFRGMYEPSCNIGLVWKHFEGRKDIVGGPHVGHTGDFWEQHNPKVERFFEIYSMWGNFDELANKLLNEGARLGFTGGGDCHEGKCFFSAEDKERQGKVPHGFAHGGSGKLFYKCGITGALMDKLDRETLIDALRNRKTYATTGARILIDFSVSEIPMGREGKIRKPVVRAEVHGCDLIKKVEVIRDGEVAWSCNGSFFDKEIEWENNEVEKGTHWYYLTVFQEDGEMAWTSPIWVEVL